MFELVELFSAIQQSNDVTPVLRDTARSIAFPSRAPIQYGTAQQAASDPASLHHLTCASNSPAPCILRHRMLRLSHATGVLINQRDCDSGSPSVRLTKSAEGFKVYSRLKQVELIADPDRRAESPARQQALVRCGYHVSEHPTTVREPQHKAERVRAVRFTTSQRARSRASAAV